TVTTTFHLKSNDIIKTTSAPDHNGARSAMRKKAIQKAGAASDPRACARESDPGHEDKVDRRENRNIVLTASGWQNHNDFAAAPAHVRDQCPDLRFVMKRFEDDNHPGPFPNR